MVDAFDTALGASADEWPAEKISRCIRDFPQGFSQSVSMRLTRPLRQRKMWLLVTAIVPLVGGAVWAWGGGWIWYVAGCVVFLLAMFARKRIFPDELTHQLVIWSTTECVQVKKGEDEEDPNRDSASYIQDEEGRRLASELFVRWRTKMQVERDTWI